MFTVNVEKQQNKFKNRLPQDEMPHSHKSSLKRSHDEAMPSSGDVNTKRKKANNCFDEERTYDRAVEKTDVRLIYSLNFLKYIISIKIACFFRYS